MSFKRVLLITASVAFVASSAFAQAPAAAPAPTPAPASAPAPAAAIIPATPGTPAAIAAPAPVAKPVVAAPAPVAAPTPVVKPVASAGGDNAPVTRAELPGLIRDALMNDPQIIMDAVKKMHEKQVEDSKKELKESLKKYKGELMNDTISPSIGDAKTADVTIVEFFDYHCGYCKHLLPAITKLTKEDKKVRVIFREFPILSQDSVTASRAALAVNKIAPEKYFAFHTALMETKGSFDEKAIMEVAKKQGIDGKKLKAAMDEKDITDQMDKTRAIAEDLGIRGTPALIAGDDVVPGAISYDDLKELVENIRNGKDTSKPAAKATPEPAPAKPDAKVESPKAPESPKVEAPKTPEAPAAAKPAIN